MSDSIVLVGRGPGATFTTLPDCDVMAVSSGIFALPEGMIPRYFASLDPPKFFMAGLMPKAQIAWQNDEHCKPWPFWADQRIEKHVNRTKLKHGHMRQIPMDLLDRLPEQYQHYKPQIKDSLLDAGHELGWQPGWLDYPNVHGWHCVLDGDANFDDEGEFRLSGVINTCLFAVQLAVRLGYRRLYFAGVEFNGAGYQCCREIMERWYGLAIEDGQEWINLTPSSDLARYMPSSVEVAA